MKFAYTTLDVFTSTRYAGNPLAIVMAKSPSTPSGSPTLTQAQKQAIAKEFNLSETVFLYGDDDVPSPMDGMVKIDIFTPLSELPFAGHPTIGTAWFMLHYMLEAAQQLTSQLSSTSNSPTASPAADPSLAPASAPEGKDAERGKTAAQFSLLTKAGPIPIQKLHHKPGFVKAQIPHDIHIHARTVPTPTHLITSSSSASSPQTHLHPNKNPNQNPNETQTQNPIISIVKGLSFILARIPSLSLLEKATGSLVTDSLMAAELLDEGWRERMVGTMFYVCL